MIRPPALLFGVPIADVTMDEAIDVIGAFVDDGRRLRRTHQVATVNVDFLVNALEDRELHAILQRADLCLADGMPILWGTSLLGMPIRERVTGADLVPRLAEASASRGWRVHMFGSSPEVAERAGQLIDRRYPGASVSFDPGPAIPDPATVDDRVLESIAATGADILCVALGNPKQELFIHAHRRRLGVPVMIGIGGSLDMLVGERRRAPGWVQRIGFEWVARAVQEPRRLGRRYAHDIRIFGPALLSEWRRARSRSRGGGIAIELLPTRETVVAQLGGGTMPDPQVWHAAAHRLLGGAPLRVRFEGASGLRDAAWAQLVGLVQCASRGAGEVEWVDDAGRVDAALQALRLTDAMVGRHVGR